MTSKMNKVEPVACESIKIPPQSQNFVYPLLQVWYYSVNNTTMCELDSDNRKAVVVANNVHEAISLLARAFDCSPRDLDRSAVRMVNQYERGVYIMNNRPTIH